MIEVTVLGSGSSGNATLIRSERTSILIDAGFSHRQLKLRMASVGWDPARLDAVIISHEHTDHICGLRVLCKRHSMPVFSAEATFASRRFDEMGLTRIEHVNAGEEFSIGDLDIKPFSVPHDAADPLGFIVRCNGMTLGHVTDLGYAPELTARSLQECNILVLESNHDPDMLLYGPYPWPIKQRILSRTGHLSNSASSELLAKVASSDLAVVFLAHLSQQNNTPELALQAHTKVVGAAAGLYGPEIVVTAQHAPSRSIRLC
ncbi:MAG TPA: MBL fold metallo-hydrolase [Acidobacteriota bacterium]|nr:MBL fold metallo-hydrolase [Acidobacteriota bacterium]